MSAPFDPKTLREAFGAFMTGVTVVTSHDQEGAPVGFTANSFTSVSLDPPLVLACLARTSRSFEAFTLASGFAVNVLAEDQKAISNTFARPVEDRFAGLAWEKGPHGAPVLANVAAWFDCSVEKIVEAGDHVILLGRVEAFDSTKANGLGYARGSYFTPELAQEAVTTAGAEAEVKAAVVATRDDEVLLFEWDDARLALPLFDLARDQGSAALTGRLQEATGLPVAVGFVYAVYGSGNERRIVYRCEIGPGRCKRGRFFSPASIPLDRIVDAETCAILRQFVSESTLSAFGETRQAAPRASEDKPSDT